MSESQSETENIIKNIIPALNDLGWEKDGFSYQVSCSSGLVDILYSHKGSKIAVIEAKKKGKGRKGALKQAIKYAKSMSVPIALATDWETFLDTHNVKKECPLRNQSGREFSLEDRPLLNIGNLLYLVKNPSLQKKIKNEEELRTIFKNLNDKGKDIGLTTGVERLQEIAKIIFIKMLVDNQQYLEQFDWDTIQGVPCDRVIPEINNRLRSVKENGIDVGDLLVNQNKSNEVKEILSILDAIDFNCRHYDANSTLFQSFLSERARGGTTNDLGQYFTPRNLIKLMYSLSDYQRDESVYDPFCGTGGILCHFFLEQIKKLDTDNKKKEFASKCLFGSEISNQIANLAKMNMVLIGDGHSNIEPIDSISRNNKYISQEKKFDKVITNMPFKPSVPSDVLNDYFSISPNSSDVAKYIEHCINRCKLRGRIVIIVGKGFLTEKASAPFREKLLSKYELQCVYNLYSGIFLPYTPVFSSMLVINKKKHDEDRFVDFFSIKDENDLLTVEKYHSSEERYSHGYYKVGVDEILSTKSYDLRGMVYKKEEFNPDTHCRIRDLVDYVPSNETEQSEPGLGLKKMTTPNSIEDGILLIDAKSSKQKDDGYGSFTCVLQKGGVVISRITNQRVDFPDRYLGSAMVGDHEGQLITKEYYQLIPKNKDHLYYILFYLRKKNFQEIAEWASGTGGQQRVDINFILDKSIPKPTPAGIAEAQDALNAIQNNLEEIDRLKREIRESRERIYTV